MLQRMLLKGLLDEVGGLQNATNKRKIRISTKTFY